MANQITDREFWNDYWRSKPDLAVAVKRNHTFHKLLRRIVSDNATGTAIELGGFPGHYAVFLKKYFEIDSTVFDYFVDPDTLTRLLAKNGLGARDIAVIEADLFDFHPVEQYDLVLSCGLIEHFDDTNDILRRHVRFLKHGGTLFVALPNFTGANGWVQRTFDVSNYEKHNIKSMDPARLKSACQELGLTEIACKYYGKFSVWLEKRDEKPAVVQWLVKSIWFLGKALTTIVPFESRTLSPYIVLIARKP